MLKRSFALLILGTFFTSCAGGYKSSVLKFPSELDLVTCVAVLPFEYVKADKGEDAGKIISIMLSERLLSTKKFRVLEWDEVEAILKDQNVTLPASLDSGYASRIGEILGVDGVMYGSVTEYGYRDVGKSFDSVAVVGLLAKLLSVRSKDVVWASTYTASSSDLLGTGREALSKVALRAVNELVRSFAGKIKKRNIDYKNICWNPIILSDIDGDGILNFADRCPLELESLNGILDTDGCPEPDIAEGDFRKLVDLRDGKIVYEGEISYVENQATLLPTSIPILKGIASLLGEHPEISRVTIEGFSGGGGAEKFTEEFSFYRAMAVKSFLMREGVADDRLAAVGYDREKYWKKSLVKEIEFSVSK